MISTTVWLLVMVASVNSGTLGAVQPHLYPTAQACEQVRDSAPENPRYPGSKPAWRCVQTTVLVPK